MCASAAVPGSAVTATAPASTDCPISLNITDKIRTQWSGVPGILHCTCCNQYACIANNSRPSSSKASHFKSIKPSAQRRPGNVINMQHRFHVSLQRYRQLCPEHAEETHDMMQCAIKEAEQAECGILNRQIVGIAAHASRQVMKQFQLWNSTGHPQGMLNLCLRQTTGRPSHVSSMLKYPQDFKQEHRPPASMRRDQTT